MSPIPERGAATLEQMRAAWEAAGQAREALNSVAWIGGAVLEDGEPVDGPRGMALAAPRAAMLLHRAADTALAGYPAPVAMLPEFADAVEAYVEHARTFEPEDAYYLANHRGHLMFVRPDERRFITAEMIRKTSFIGTAADLTQRIGALRDAGSTRWCSPSRRGRSMRSRIGAGSAEPLGDAAGAPTSPRPGTRLQ